MSPKPDYTLPRLEVDEGSVSLCVHVVPGASRDRIVGVHVDALKVAVAAPPEKGKANERVVRLLASELGLGRAQVRLEHGKTSRKKIFRLTGLSLSEAQERLRQLLSRRGSTR